ncbi:MAG: hypothetical protein J6B06_03250 [Lachnospiraceae bacterium]|nr:hypothetical protein [Lachnospiraceae bacterium]
MDKKLIEQFENPGADKRSFPFWGWNSRLDKDELQRQIREMKDAGVGGFFIHSRDGLETEYLGEEWMDCVKIAVEEAKNQGMYAWLYDEDRWPSGTAGGRVTACGDEYRCKGLTLEVLSAKKYSELYEYEIQGENSFADNRNGLLAVYRAIIDGDAIKEYKRLSLQKGEEFGTEEVLLAVRLEVSAPSEWFNHEAPPDNLNPNCVKRFIAETHERYRQVVGSEFGKTVPGIFTDEPSLNDRHVYFGENRSWIPWTYGYGEYFKELAGYDFFELLPEFFFHGERSAKVRHDYWYSITKRYGESYFKVIGEWCEENKLYFTGHFLQEDKLGLSTRVNGAIMPNYQYQHVPGIDMLCEQTGEYMTVKQCTSVASQLGKKQVISETYGCTGWEFTFEGQKWMGDWQFVLGVNRRCQHLALYSLRGCRKRDYPPSFNYNTTWWTENKRVDDYFARLSVVLEQGEAVRDILLLHSVTTAWSRLGVNPYGNPIRRQERDVPALNVYGDELNNLIEYLERQHLDCDLGDELLIEQYGTAAEGRFVIGRASYLAVVLPPVDTLLAPTCERLFAYMNQGGLVYALRSHPYMVAGSVEEWQQYSKLTSHENWIAVDTQEELAEKLEPYRTVQIQEASEQECKDILYQLRKTEKDYILFVVNNNREQEKKVTIRLPFQAEPVRMELLTGEVEPLTSYRNTTGGTEVSLELPPTGSAVYYLNACREKERETEAHDIEERSLALQESEASALRKTVYAGPFSYRLDRENVLPLDICRYRIDENDWSEQMEVWQAQKQIRENLGMRQIHLNGLEQRYKWTDLPHPEDGHKVQMLFTFESKQQIMGASLVVERLLEFDITLNEQEISKEKTGWYLDREFETCVLPEIRAGENTLILSCDYTNGMELENIYLIGTFGVDKERQLTTLSDSLTAGDWVEQGLKHYCGNVTYCLEYEHTPCTDGEASEVILRLPETKAVYVKITINGHERLLLWNFTQDISIGDWLVAGRNEIAIEAAGSPRNMMGPFHIKKKPYNTNDASFCPSEKDYSSEYLLTPYGIMGRIEVVQIAEMNCYQHF